MGKKFGIFFFYIQVWQTSMNKYLGSTRSFDSFCWIYKIIFLGPKRSTETTFTKKRQSSRWEKNDQFVFVLPSLANVKNILLGSKLFFGNHCASHKIISVTPKRLSETQFFEKGFSSTKKDILAVFFLVFP